MANEPPRGPDLFLQELADAFATIATQPLLGARYRHPTVLGVRRFLLRATRHHVYYLTREQQVVVVAVWSAVRGAGPDLKAP